MLRDYPKMRVRVEGHTDGVGSAASNQKLSERRAQSVLQYLVSKGIDRARLTSAGYGVTRPIASNRTVQGRAQNRRTEFQIISMGD